MYPSIIITAPTPSSSSGSRTLNRRITRNIPRNVSRDDSSSIYSQSSSIGTGAGNISRNVPHYVPRNNAFNINNQRAMNSEDALYTIPLHDTPYQPPQMRTVNLDQPREYEWITLLVVVVLSAGVSFGSWRLAVAKVNSFWCLSYCSQIYKRNFITISQYNTSETTSKPLLFNPNNIVAKNLVSTTTMDVTAPGISDSSETTTLCSNSTFRSEETLSTITVYTIPEEHHRPDDRTNGLEVGRLHDFVIFVIVVTLAGIAFFGAWSLGVVCPAAGNWGI
ncbi:hypothetical protein K440DRAFT_641442 [Wilcoxina mikolae CBS 423.85]|nr:hypothetical protein K440DRAFT_641442 [Wilcoxina mikolae CBS 423.85]